MQRFVNHCRFFGTVTMKKSKDMLKLEQSSRLLFTQTTDSAPLSTDATKKKFLVRPASHKDYDAIMEIGDVMQGKDYLPHMYHRYIEDPDVYPFVIVTEDRPIAFFMCQLLDGGTTSFFSGGRIHEDFRNSGLTNLISKGLFGQSRAFKPAIKRMAGTIRSHMSPSLLLSSGFREVLRKRDIIFSYKSKNIVPLTSNEKKVSSEVKELTASDLESLFNNTELIKNLFPLGLLFTTKRGISYRPISSNIRHLKSDFSSVFATTKTISRESLSKHACQNSKKENQKRNFCDTMLSQIDMISLSESHPSLSGHAYSCEIFCSTDVSSIHAHILHHVKRMAEVTPSNGVFVLSFPDCIGEGIMLPILAKYGIKNIIEVAGPHMILFETVESKL